MRILYLAVTAAAIFATYVTAEETWSWKTVKDTSKQTAVIEKRSDNLESKTNETKPAGKSNGRHLYSDQEIYSNDTSIDEVIESILQNSRTGRALDGYDEVYSDPSVQEALQKGDDVQARNLIKDKLCLLGLMSCDTNDPEGKRPFYSTIYAQGPPPPGRRPGPPYGPPKPMPAPGKFGPPRKVGYEPSPQYSKPYISNRPPGPVYPGPYLDSAPNNVHDNSISFSKPPPGSIIYGSKPPGPVYTGGDAPYNFEHIVGEKIHVGEDDHHHHHPHHHQSSSYVSEGVQFGSHSGSFGVPNPVKPTIVVNAQGGNNPVSAASAATLQQHVHHHFHHIDGEGDASAKKQPAIVTVPVPVPVPTGNGISSQFIANSATGYTPGNSGFSVNSVASEYELKKQISQSAAFNAGFNGASQGNLISGTTGFSGVNSGYNQNGGLYASASAIKPVSEGGLGNYGGNYGQGNYAQASSGIYNGNSGSFHSGSPDYYKKELNGGSQQNGFNTLTTNQQNSYSQFGGQNQYNPGENYQGFETARQQNIDCVCLPFNQCPAADRIGRKDDLILPLDPRNLGTDIEALGDDVGNSTSSSKDSVSDKNESKKSKREVQAQAKQAPEDEDDLPEDAQARLISNYGSNFGNNFGNLPQTAIGLTRKKVAPTFGVSFGLPYPSGAYPFNAYGGGFPAVNPYFGAIGPNGLNLGLLNVNPLFSVQVAKDEYGDKIVKPFVNLHVTPSENLVHKVGSIFQAKTQEYLLNKHQHYHSHTHLLPTPEIYHPHHHHPQQPYPIHNGPEFYPSNYDGNYQYGFNQQQAIAPPQIPNYPFDGFVGNGAYDPFQRSYNITRGSNLQYNQIRFNGDVTGSGYADAYKHPAFGDNRLGKDINFENDSNYYSFQNVPTPSPGHNEGGERITFPRDRRRRKRSLNDNEEYEESFGNIKNETKLRKLDKRQSYFGSPRPTTGFQQCHASEVCCRRPYRQLPQQQQQLGRCGTRNAHGITGRIKTPVYVDGDSEFGEYPWQVAILKKDPKESVYVCGGTIIDQQHVLTAAHCVKTYQGFDLRVRLGEWDVNHDVEFFPYIERDVISVTVHPEYYAGTLDNDLAVLRLDQPIDFSNNPHISPICMPDKFSDFTGSRCWTTGWGKDAFGDFGKYQNILKEVDVPIIAQQQCQNQLRNTRLGYNFRLHPGFVCAGGEEGKDACKGDGGGSLVCERNGIWQMVGVVSWGIGCGQVNVPGVYVRVSYYLDWLNQVTRY